VRAPGWILACAARSAGAALVPAAPGLAATAVASGAPSVAATIGVSPAAGSPASVFVVRFRAGDRTGTAGGQRRWDALSVTRLGAAAPAGCVAAAQLTLPPSQRGAAVRARLDPRAIGAGTASRSWCAGAYSGWIRQFAAAACKLGQACPDYILALGAVGRFSFTVHAPPSAAAAWQSR